MTDQEFRQELNKKLESFVDIVLHQHADNLREIKNLKKRVRELEKKLEEPVK